MKKIIVMLILAALLLTACSNATQTREPADLQKIYDTVTAQMPEMILLDSGLRLDLLGIDEADCEEAFTAICSDSMRVDEVWVIRAKDNAALQKLTALAQSRIDAQAEVCESYSPEQFAVVKKAEIVTEGLDLVLIISPEAAALRTAVEELLK